METEAAKHDQCPGNGCAAGLMKHLREQCVDFQLVRGGIGVGFLALVQDGDGMAAVARHDEDLQRHEDRITLLLWSELGGRN